LSRDSYDLLQRTIGTNLIKEINKIDRWNWLKSTKQTRELRRYPGIRLVSGPCSAEWDRALMLVKPRLPC
jgi:hypothetical protein